MTGTLRQLVLLNTEFVTSSPAIGFSRVCSVVIILIDTDGLVSVEGPDD